MDESAQKDELRKGGGSARGIKASHAGGVLLKRGQEEGKKKKKEKL